MTGRAGPGVVIGVAAGVALLASCAQAPGVDGAQCPCPIGYYCDSSRGVCLAGPAPEPPPYTPMGGRPANPPPSNPSSPPPMNNVPPATCVQIGVVPPRPLSAAEYRNTLVDLLGFQPTPDELPMVQLGASGFSNSAEHTGVTELLRALAPRLASRLVGSRRMSELIGCEPDRTDEEPCVAGFIDRFARRLYRRPLLEVERGSLLAAFSVARQKQTFMEAVANVIAQLLASDQFLVRRETGGPIKPPLQRVALTGFEVATRLSYLLWASTPDDALLEAAAAGRLDNPEGVRAEAERLLADGRAERSYLQFFREWLEIDSDTLEQAGQDVPEFGPELRAAVLPAVLESADALVLQVIRAQDAPLMDWQTWPRLYANRAMATFYGLAPPTGDGFAWLLPMGDQQRSGPLTIPARLANAGSILETRPVARGMWVNQRLRCFAEIAPPDNVKIPPPPPATAEMSTKQRFEEHRSNAGCNACHQFIDPLGFALDNYDGIGRWRTREGNYDIDASGAIGTLTFSGPGDLARALSESPDVRACMVRQWFRYGFGRRDQDEDACVLDRVNEQFAAGGYRTRALLLALVASEAFTTLPAPTR
jgi:hypothetical protein